MLRNPTVAVAALSSSAIPSNSDTRLESGTRVLDDYVLIRKSDSAPPLSGQRCEDYKGGLNKPSLISPSQNVSSDVAEAKAPAMSQVNGSSVTAAARARMGGRMRPMRTKLCVRLFAGSAANTALTTVTALTPTSSSEWSSFSGLYDEYKVHGVDVKSIVSCTNTATITQPEFAVMAYDPAGTAALAATVDGCVYRQHLLCPATGNTNSTWASSDVSSSASGLHNFNVVVPQGGFVADSAVPTNVVGGWSVTSSTDSCGYLKYYIPALGSGVSSLVSAILFFDVTFRTRQ